jgi:DNA primase
MPKNESRFVDFRAVKAAVSIEQVLAHWGVLERFTRGRDSLTGPCPIHDGKNPKQFRVSISKNCWNCFSECKCGGNVLDLVARRENVDPMVAANRLVDWFQLDRAELNAAHGREIPSRTSQGQSARGSTRETVNEALPPPILPPPPAPKPNGSAPRPVKEESGTNEPLGFQLDLDPVHPYLMERGLTPETIEEFGLGYCTKGVMAQRIAIPIQNAKGELVGYAGRWPGEPPDGRPKYRFPDGFKKSVEVFRLAAALQEPAEQPLVIVGGFFDAIRLWQFGVRKCVALMSNSLSPAQEALLVQHLSPESKVIAMFAQNEAGDLGRESVLHRLSFRAFVRVVSFAHPGFRPEQLTAEEAQLLRLC